MCTYKVPEGLCGLTIVNFANFSNQKRLCPPFNDGIEILSCACNLTLPNYKSVKCVRWYKF